MFRPSKFKNSNFIPCKTIEKSGGKSKKAHKILYFIAENNVKR